MKVFKMQRKYPDFSYKLISNMLQLLQQLVIFLNLRNKLIQIIFIFFNIALMFALDKFRKS